MKRPLLYSLILLQIVIVNISFAQSIELDKKLGKENAEMVKAQMGIYDDQPKTMYIRSIGNRLLSKLDNKQFNYEFHIVPEASPNAFALPGGHVFITTGILPIIETEDELACIMAHEIIHAHNRHSVKQMKKSILPRLLEVPGNLIGVLDKNLGAIFNAPIQTSNALLLASYGRGYETEADLEGTKLAANAGYDPSAMISGLSRMSAAIEKATGKSEQKSYFNDHPYTPDRVKNIEKNNKKLSWTKKAGNAPNFNLKFDSLLFGDHPNKGVINENQFLHPDMNFSIFFPKKWDIENQSEYVGAYHPERKAAVYLTLDKGDLTPEKAGKKFLADLDKNYKSRMKDSKPIDVDGKKGYIVSFEEKTRAGTMYAYALWVQLDGKLFQLLGITPIAHKPELEKAARSLRTLNDKEKQNFKINLVRVRKAKSGETITAFSNRTGNKLNEELTAVLNSKKVNDRLKEGEELKVVIQYPYKVE